MSTRIFAQALFDAHNQTMADRHQAQAYPLRLTEDLKERVSDSAKANGRSLNAEISARLQRSFESFPDATLIAAESREHWLARNAAAAAHVPLAYLFHEMKTRGLLDDKWVDLIDRSLARTAPYAQLYADKSMDLLKEEAARLGVRVVED